MSSTVLFYSILEGKVLARSRRATMPVKLSLLQLTRSLSQSEFSLCVAVTIIPGPGCAR